MSDSMPITNPVWTQAIVNHYFMHAKKNLGQNFLVDLTAIKGAVEAADIQSGDQTIKIGLGIGSLTEQPLLAGVKVLAHEVDQDPSETLKNELPQKIDGEELNSRFKLVIKGILKTNFVKGSDGFLDLGKPAKIVANLPCYIITLIVFNLVESDLDFSSLTPMMQKEATECLVVIPKAKEYDPLAAAVQSRMNVELTEGVKGTPFIPHPKVGSAVAVLTPLIEKPDIGDYSFFDHVVKMCFAQRHKALASNLRSLVRGEDTCERTISDLRLDLRARPGELTLNQFVELVHLLKDQQA